MILLPQIHEHLKMIFDNVRCFSMVNYLQFINEVYEFIAVLVV